MIDQDSIQDESLSWKARGLLSYLLSMPDDWTVQISHLKKQAPDGRDSVRSAIQELEKAGYIDRERDRQSDGTFGGWEYVVYERPRANGNLESASSDGNSKNGETDSGSTDVGESDFDKSDTTKQTKEQNTKGNKVNSEQQYAVDVDREELIERLEEIGVQEQVASDLVSTYPGRTEDYIDALEWEIESNDKSPGFAVSMIRRGDYDKNDYEDRDGKYELI